MNDILRSGFTATALTAVTLLGNAVTLLENAATAEAVAVTVTIDDLSPDEGLVLTPFWVGFYKGGYDLYNLGEAASEGLELIAEDGDVSVLSSAFASGNRVDGVITGDGIGPNSPPLIGPDASTSLTLDVYANNSFFSFASMILPSNDAFISNESETAHRVFDVNGEFIGTDFVAFFWIKTYFLRLQHK